MPRCRCRGRLLAVVAQAEAGWHLFRRRLHVPCTAWAALQPHLRQRCRRHVCGDRMECAGEGASQLAVGHLQAESPRHPGWSRPAHSARGLASPPWCQQLDALASWPIYRMTGNLLSMSQRQSLHKRHTCATSGGAQRTWQRRRVLGKCRGSWQGARAEARVPGSVWSRAPARCTPGHHAPALPALHRTAVGVLVPGTWQRTAACRLQ